MDESQINKIIKSVLRLKTNPILGLIGIMCLVSVMVLNYYFSQNITSNNQQQSVDSSIVASTNSPQNLEGPYKVVRVIDGDTIDISDSKKEYKVRYIGVDTPETVKPNVPVQCYGKEASDYNKHILDGREVYLEKDAGDLDIYGRELRYVYILDNNNYQMVNSLLLQNGYARVLTIKPNTKYSTLFLDIENKVKAEKVGLWGKC